MTPRPSAYNRELNGVGRGPPCLNLLYRNSQILIYVGIGERLSPRAQAPFLRPCPIGWTRQLFTIDNLGFLLVVLTVCVSSFIPRIPSYGMTFRV